MRSTLSVSSLLIGFVTILFATNNNNNINNSNIFVSCLSSSPLLFRNIQVRQSKLYNWKTNEYIGWCIERQNKEQNTLDVCVGWNDNKDGTTITIPLRESEHLGNSMWPSALANAILMQSPTYQQLVADKTVLELGSGLGLPGLVTAKYSKCCILSDNDDGLVESLQNAITMNQLNDNNNNNNDNENDDTNAVTTIAKFLDWRDNHGENPECVDMIIGSDIAYYFFLLRPLMDTCQTFLTKNAANPLILITCQANRSSFWDLYHNILDGCYNQLTDEHEGPWEGTTKMILYNLDMTDWEDETNESNEFISDGTLPIGVLMYARGQYENLKLTSEDYAATKEDEESMMMTF